MGTARLNIWLRNSQCDLLTNCWRTDLVLQACTGTYLVDSFPSIIQQLKARYAKPSAVDCVSQFPLGVDQSGKTLTIAVGTETPQSLVFTSPATELIDVFGQIKASFTNCIAQLVDGVIRLTSIDRGPQANIVISGDNDLVWGPIESGGGYRILKHHYQGAWRILLQPPTPETINHIEVDVPPGCYKVWTRVCHGNNEETSVAMVGACCGDHVCVNLMLPTIKTCSAQIVHPLMDQVVHQQFLVDDMERVNVFRALLWGAGVGKVEAIAQLDYRLQEAQDKGDNDLENRVLAVRQLADLLPECY